MRMFRELLLGKLPLLLITVLLILLAPLLTTDAARNIAVVDSTSGAGWDTSVAVNQDDNPVVTYYDATNRDLKLSACSDPACTSKTVNIVDNAGDVGTHTSLVLNSSGNPVISYLDVTNFDLKLAVCGNATCSAGNIIVTLDSSGIVGEFTSLALNSSGNPFVSYYDAINGDLKLAICGDATCISKSITVVDSVGNVGWDTSLALSSAGNPVISYYDDTNGDLKLAVCSDPTCASKSISTVDSTGTVGWDTSLALNSAGNPVISYYDITNGDLKVAACSDATCVNKSISTVDSAGVVGWDISLMLNGSGYPVISYRDSTNADLKLAVCGNATCTAGNTISIVDSAGSVGWFSAMALNSSGSPVISYFDATNQNLKLALMESVTVPPIPPTPIPALMTAPAIVDQPDSQTISSGSTASLTVVATGDAPLTYQWYQGASGDTGTPVGTNTSTFTPSALTSTAFYWVRVSNAVGNVSSETAAITVQTAQNCGIDTVGIYRASDFSWYQRYSNTAGFAETIFNYGLPSDVSMIGDWDGDGYDTVGIRRGDTFYLKNNNTSGAADITFAFGAATDIPVAGDWNGDGIDTIGVYRPDSATWFLRNSNSSGGADTAFTYGLPNETPVAGDWNGDGLDTVGIYRDSDFSWYLRNSNSDGFAEIILNFGLPSDDAVVGDWNGDCVDTVGLYRPAEGNWYLKNTNASGTADLAFAYGLPDERGVTGHWLPADAGLAVASAEVAAELTPEAADESTQEPTPELTLEPAVEEPTQEPAEEATAQATEEPSDEQPDEATEAPVATATPEPEVDPTEAVTDLPLAEPTEAPAPERQLITIETSDPAVAFSGAWTGYASEAASGGDYLYSSGAGSDRLELTFDGSYAELLVVTHPSLGNMLIEVDGVVMQNISLAQEAALGIPVMIGDLPSGLHTLRLYPENAGMVIAVDAFLIDGAVLVPAVTPPAPVLDNTALVADFTYSAADLSVNFRDASTAGNAALTTWAWDFGTGTISTDQYPSYTFPSPGTYTVTLLVSNDQGSSAVVSKIVTVTDAGEMVDNQTPMANFATTIAGQDAAFTDQSTDDSGIVGWAWDFGDGGWSAMQHTAYTYAAAGTYIVTLTVTDIQGATGTFSQPVVIAAANQSPTASFAYLTDKLNVAFTDQSTDDGGIVGWAWDFGDGSSSTMQHAAYTYAAAGTYTVALTVTDAQGITHTTSQFVTVSNPVHVGDIEAASQVMGIDNTWEASVIVTVHDTNEQPVPNAIVKVSWNGGVPVEALTDLSGNVTFHSSTAPAGSSLLFTVIDVVQPAYGEYLPASNHDLDMDSTGTEITISG